MRLRYLDTDFLARASSNATATAARSILHACSIDLEGLDYPLPCLPEIVLEQAQQHKIDEKPLPELGSCLESFSEQRFRDKLLQNLLPFKQECHPILHDAALPAGSMPPRLQPFVLEIPEVSSPDEEHFEIQEIFMAQHEMPLGEGGELAGPNAQAAVLQIEPVEFQPLVVPVKEWVTKVLPSKQVVFLESEEVDLTELSTSGYSKKGQQSEDVPWDPHSIALGLGIQEVELELPGDLVGLQLFEDLVQVPAVSLRLPAFSPEEQGPIEELLFESFNVGKVSIILEAEQVSIPEPGLDREDTVAEIVNSLSLATPHVDLKFLDDSTMLSHLYEKLVLVPELSLRCNIFKALPVPTFYASDGQEKVEEFVIGALASLAKCSQPSATDFIYLDWHLSEGNACNDHRCFYIKSRHLWGVPEKVTFGADQQEKNGSTVSQDQRLPSLNFLSEPPVDSAPAKVREAHVLNDLEAPVPDHAARIDARRKSGTFGCAGARLSSNETCTGIFVVNSRLVNKYGLISRRSTYQKILALEKEGAQVVERDLRLPIDVILNPTKCLSYYSPEKLRMREQLSSISACIENIIDNDMKAISFGFQQCIMVFEGDKSFTAAVLQTVDDIYAAAVGLSIHVQCFVSSSPANTDSILLNCLRGIASSPRFPRMTESATLAEAFLTESPAINPVAAHAILSTGKTLSAFISMAPEEQLVATKPFTLSGHSLQLFKAQCEYGQPAEYLPQSHFGDRYGQGMEPPSCGYGQHSPDPVHNKNGRQAKRTYDDDRAKAFQILKRREEVLQPLLSPSKQVQEMDGFQDHSGPYFPTAAELDDDWKPAHSFVAAPNFPPAEQLDEDWDESPAMPLTAHGMGGAASDEFDNIVNKIPTGSDFGFSSNRRQSSSNSSVKDALKTWLSAREQSKRNSKKSHVPPPALAMTRDEAPTPTSLSRKTKDNVTAANCRKESGGAKRNKANNDIFTLWENFKYRNQSQAATPSLSTSKSFKRPSSSVFSTSPGQNNSTSCSVQQLQQHRGGKRTRRTTT